MMPRFTVERVRKELKTTFPTANAAIQTLHNLGIINEITGKKKNRSFSYQSYIQLLSK
jgi:Fic family protein